MRERSLWRRLRSPITGLGTGPKAWALTRFPGAMHRVLENLRTRFVRSHLSAEGAWWLRERVEGIVPMRLSNSVIGARERDGKVELQLRAMSGRVEALNVDRVIAGSGYLVDVDRMTVLEGSLRAGIRRIGAAPRLDGDLPVMITFLGCASWDPRPRWASARCSASLSAQISPR